VVSGFQPTFFLEFPENLTPKANIISNNGQSAYGV
jgi:hypothetical protein